MYMIYKICISYIYLIHKIIFSTTLYVVGKSENYWIVIALIWWNVIQPVN